MPIFSLRIVFYYTSVLQGHSLKYKRKGREKKQKAALCPFIEHSPPGEVLLCLGTDTDRYTKAFLNLTQSDSKILSLRCLISAKA